MAKKKIFISSVQAEFSNERKMLHEYICADPLLGKFFEPFLFELLPAIDRKADDVYIREIEMSDIYIGLFGVDYGFQNSEGISPTEIEFNKATELYKTRLVFLSDKPMSVRHEKEQLLITKAQAVIVRKMFSSPDELKSSVYASLVRYLEEKEIIRTGPFDASTQAKATLSDLDDEKIIEFIRIAKSKRGFALHEFDSKEKILTHLNLLDGNAITNAALLLFGKLPQRFFICSEVRCASFHGTTMQKPIPSYKVFKGTVFELVDQTVEFILSKLDYGIETRAQQNQIPGGYEIPREIITEAVVNAIAHRDYTSNASVQVMLFKDRLEIWNPGSLPLGWTTEKLKHLHTSVPANPLLAEPMYLAGYIERLGTGTSEMVQKSKDAGLQEPQFLQAEDFGTIVYRPVTDNDQDTMQDNVHNSSGLQKNTPQDTPQVTPQVANLIRVMTGDISRDEIQEMLQLKDRENFRKEYLNEALLLECIEMTIPDKPTSKNQKYRLTQKGRDLQQTLKKRKK